MGKMVGLAEFKAHCLRLIAEMEATGEPITLTRRGKPVAEVKPQTPEEKLPPEGIFGLIKDTVEIRGDIISPSDPDWEAKWDAKWKERLRGDGSAA